MSSVRKAAVVINGYPSSGKDTACRYVIQHLKRKGWRGNTISSVDPVRNMLRSMGVPVDNKTQKIRDLMAEVQFALNRYEWFPIQMSAGQVTSWLSEENTPGLCFVHIRETDAITRFRALLADTQIETYTLFVDRKKAARGDFTNAADREVETVLYDVVIDNNTTMDDLHDRCARFAERIVEGPITGGIRFV